MKQKQIAVLVFENVNLLDMAGPIQVFAQANGVDANSSTHYNAIAVSKIGGLVKSSSGICIDTVSLNSATISSSDTIIIAGGYGIQRILDDEILINWVKRHFEQSCRISSVCTGAYLLAQTGLLDYKRATTHWRSLEHFQASFPNIRVERDSIYVCDQGVWSSAGITAGIDLALAMLAQDIGHQASLETARELVVYMKRPGGQAQFSETLNFQMKDRQGVFDDLHYWLKNNLHLDLSVERLADHMSMSSRTFYRTYKRLPALHRQNVLRKYVPNSLKKGLNLTMPVFLQ